MTIEDKQRYTVQAIVLLQCYVHLHDKAIEENGITQRTKQLSKNLVEELEKKDFMQITSRLCKVGGDSNSYISCIRDVEALALALSRMPFQYWSDITKGINDLYLEEVAKGEISPEEITSNPESL